MFWVDNNPCWKDYDPKLRVKFLGSLACMDNLDASLKFLNGFQIEIPERVKKKNVSFLLALFIF